jgi:hypothetical protein
LPAAKISPFRLRSSRNDKTSYEKSNV